MLGLERGDDVVRGDVILALGSLPEM